MKKALLTAALVLVMVTSIIAGTLAMYTTSIDNVAEGGVVAKEFILLENGTDTFAQNVKVAPSETNTWMFSVKNYDGAFVSETAMDLSVSVNVQAASGKMAIAPLTVIVKDEGGNQVGATVTGTGTIQFNDSFALSQSGQEKTYTVTASWPSDNNVDINFAGAGYGTNLQVSVTGTQA